MKFEQLQSGMMKNILQRLQDHLSFLLNLIQEKING